MFDEKNIIALIDLLIQLRVALVGEVSNADVNLAVRSKLKLIRRDVSFLEDLGSLVDSLVSQAEQYKANFEPGSPPYERAEQSIYDINFVTTLLPPLVHPL